MNPFYYNTSVKSTKFLNMVTSLIALAKFVAGVMFREGDQYSHHLLTPEVAKTPLTLEERGVTDLRHVSPV
jgi:hypothetical protein